MKIKQMKKSAAYEKRILLAVCGMAPQIVTETLYALAVAEREKFIPTEIHLITTNGGAQRAFLHLLHPKDGKFHQFCRDYGLSGIDFTRETIHVIRDENGTRLEDIKTPAQNEAAADFITQMMSRFTRDDDAALHVSIAGGRKTMGYYVGYALSLYGRAQDRLSHVLVTEGYENLPNFFYPTVESQVICTRDGEPLDTQKAQVMLAEIPFVRLRGGIPPKLLAGKAGFSESVLFAQRFEGEPHLLLDKVLQKVWANGVAVKLKGIDFAFYLWMLEETVFKAGVIYRQVDKSPEYAESFLSLYRALNGSGKDIEKTEHALRDGMEAQWLSERMSGVSKAFKQAAGDAAAQKFTVSKEGTNNNLRYRLNLLKEQVEFA